MWHVNSPLSKFEKEEMTVHIDNHSDKIVVDAGIVVLDWADNDKCVLLNDFVCGHQLIMSGNN